MMPSTEHVPVAVPTRSDLEAYGALRTAGKDVHQRVLASLPSVALAGVAMRLGMAAEGGLRFPGACPPDAYASACVYAWSRGGETSIQAFARQQRATGTPRLTPLEVQYLDAAVLARHSVFRVEELVAGAGVVAFDVRRGTRYFLVDRQMSTSDDALDCWVASHIVPARAAGLGDWYMTTGSPLGLGRMPRSKMQAYIELIERDSARNGPSSVDFVTCAFIRLALRLHAERASYKRVLPVPPHGRKDSCPCGSGRKYKHCCRG